MHGCICMNTHPLLQFPLWTTRPTLSWKIVFQMSDGARTCRPPAGPAPPPPLERHISRRAKRGPIRVAAATWWISGGYAARLQSLGPQCLKSDPASWNIFIIPEAACEAGSKHTELSKSEGRDERMEWKEEMFQSCSRDAAGANVAGDASGNKRESCFVFSSTHFSARDHINQFKPFNSCNKAVTLNQPWPCDVKGTKLSKAGVSNA